MSCSVAQASRDQKLTYLRAQAITLRSSFASSTLNLRTSAIPLILAELILVSHTDTNQPLPLTSSSTALAASPTADSYHPSQHAEHRRPLPLPSASRAHPFASTHSSALLLHRYGFITFPSPVVAVPLIAG